ncbi:hypothetical protein Ahu01nite_082400 [Winogradskya humida]|uniref:Uncharacterized protein n=1 Tax=Winogradskya humida TaxID=113566 RepID=A0ABQ4A2S0_9ACTN|nr:hypothetical protein Ahu01nite_082400 [Actinoplanes humidus]
MRRRLLAAPGSNQPTNQRRRDLYNPTASPVYDNAESLSATPTISAVVHPVVLSAPMSGWAYGPDAADPAIDV